MQEIVDIKQIQAHNLYQYSVDIAEAVKDGWELSDRSEYIAQALSPYNYIVVMVKYNQKDVAEKAANVAQEATEPKAPTEKQLIKDELLATFGEDQKGKAAQEAREAEKPKRGPKPKQ